MLVKEEEATSARRCCAAALLATGRIDAFEWKRPVERIGGPLVDPADDVLADIDEPAQMIAYEDKAEPAPAPDPKPAAPEPVKLSLVGDKSAPVPPPIPATHPVPDDPGMTEDTPPAKAGLFSWKG